MRFKNPILAVIAAASLTLAGVAFTSSASADVPAPVAGNITVLPSAPRVIPMPGIELKKNAAMNIQIAGKKFGDVTVPANATGVTMNFTAASNSNGDLRVWTTGGAEPGTGAVNYSAKKSTTNITFVALDTTGKITIRSTEVAKVVASITSYVTPVPQPVKPVVKEIEKTNRELIKTGGKIRDRHTTLGSVTLAEGTYDARVIASFQGFNNKTDLPEGVFVTGSVVLTLGTEMSPDWSNNTTVGGILIPRAKSDTLTQDPTGSVSTIFTLNEPTTVEVNVFGYASDSSERDNVLKAGLDSARFLKIG